MSFIAFGNTVFNRNHIVYTEVVLSTDCKTITVKIGTLNSQSFVTTEVSDGSANSETSFSLARKLREQLEDIHTLHVQF